MRVSDTRPSLSMTIRISTIRLPASRATGSGRIHASRTASSRRRKYSRSSGGSRTVPFAPPPNPPAPCEGLGGGASIRCATRSPTPRTAARAASSRLRVSTACRTVSDSARASRIFRSRSSTEEVSGAFLRDVVYASGAATGSFAAFPFGRAFPFGGAFSFGGALLAGGAFSGFAGAGGGPGACLSVCRNSPPPTRSTTATGSSRNTGPWKAETASASTPKRTWHAPERTTIPFRGGGGRSGKNGGPAGRLPLERLGDHAKFFDPGVPDLRDDLHHEAVRDGAVGAEVHLPVRPLRHDLLERPGQTVELHGLPPDEDPVVRVDRDDETLLVAAHCLGAGLRQVHVHPLGEHGSRDHEDDEEHQHHVDQRRDVDIRHDPAIAGAAGSRHRHGVTPSRPCAGGS